MDGDVNEIKKNKIGAVTITNNPCGQQQQQQQQFSAKKNQHGDSHNEMNRRGKKRPMIYSADWTQVTKFSFIFVSTENKEKKKIEEKQKKGNQREESDPMKWNLPLYV